MRILHVNKFLHRKGGAEGYMLDLASLQRDHGHEVGFFGMEHPDNDLVAAGTPATYVDFDPPPGHVVARAGLVARMIWSRSAGRGMDEALEEFRPDVVHAHNIYHQLSPSVIHAASRRDIPVVLTLHDYKLACPTYRFLDHGEPCTACVTKGPWEAARRSCKDGSRAASTAAALEVSLHRRFGAYDGVRRFISPSRFLAAQMSAAGIYPDRIRVQSNFTDLTVSPRLGSSRHALVYAGRLSEEKGVDVLIRAVALAAAGLWHRSSDGVLLEIAGDGPERTTLEALADEVAPGLVRFHGHLPREHLEAVVRDAALSVVPSRWYENQPLAVLESFALGVPVLATNLGGLPEIVDDSTGWVVRPNDPRDMAAGLVRALGDPCGIRIRGIRARLRVEERHAPTRHLAAVTSIYEEAGART